MLRYNRHNQKVQITRFVFIAAVICLSVLFGFLFSQFLFRSFDDRSTKNKSFRASPTPSETAGVELDGDRSVTVVQPIDYPSLSIFTWFRVSSRTDEDRVVIVGNREISCDSSTQSIGYSIFYSMTAMQLFVVWRSKKSRCEIETIPVVIRPESWTHIAVVFRPVDEDNIDDILETMVYPMSACFYINGRMVSSRNSIRFLDDNRQSLTVGGSPKGENAFHGRIYQLMITTYAYSGHEVKEVYQRQSKTINMIRKKAEYSYAFDY